MDEGFALPWHDASNTVVHREEVICGIDNGCAIMQVDNEPHDGYDDVCQEVVVQDVEGETIVPEMTSVQSNNTEVVDGSNIMYLSADNVFVMQPPASQPVVTFQDNFMDCQVTEEVITDDWVNTNSEERVEIPVGEVGAEEQIEYDNMEVPLPIDQDEYTASRPYPCDFCSRRFRKKANLMNHMVAHQTDRPHGCNLCGARYIRKCDLMNHLKIHAYVPEPDALEEEDELPPLSEPEDSSDKRTKSKSKSKSKRKSAAGAVVTKLPKIKKEYEEPEYESGGARGAYNYVEEDVRLLSEMEGGQGGYGEVTTEVRYPIVDPRKPFVCQHCGVAFAREKALASHAKVHAGDSPFECETCQEMFWDVAVLREHVRAKHGGGGSGFAPDSDYDDVDDDDYVDDSKYGEFYCKVCGLRFHRMDLLRRHMRSHDDIKQETHDYGHVCTTCGQSFSEALDLLAHAEVHARHTDARCMLCGECFADEQATAAHIQQRHAKTMPPNTCMLCGKTCKDRRTLLKHSWEHSREKLFCCSKCGKCFHNKARLKRHMVSHRNKAVQCDVCGEDFPDGRSLMNHRHSHSNLSGRQFPCRECGKTFGSRSSQQIHIRIHTGERPYGCRFCWKAFADGGTLRKHERIHTGEKPYACAVCPRAFNQRVVLREHIRSHHSGPDPHYSHTITPFCCAVCNDLFSTSQDLILHLIHHCDLNTALKRQPQVGPRKYKRRRKLKPHELEIISSRGNPSGTHDDHDTYSDSDEKSKRRVGLRKPRTPPAASSQAPQPHQLPPPASPPNNKPPIEKDYEDMFQSFETAIQHMNSIVNSKPMNTRGRKKTKPVEASAASVPSRPKMIHTQKTRVPVESPADGRVRHRTRTLITRTTASEHVARDKAAASQAAAAAAAAASERNRPRTKNVSYHVQQPEKLPLATFGSGTEGEEEDRLAVDFHSVSIKADPDDGAANGMLDMEFETVETEIPDVANEETVLAQVEEAPAANSKQPTAVSMIKVTKNFGKRNNSLTPGRHIIGPGNKVIRIVKGGMLVSNKVKREPELVVPDLHTIPTPQHVPNIKQELVEPSPLHELAELSMQHAQNQFRCEMCSATFTDRSQLLMHVPIHI